MVWGKEKEQTLHQTEAQAPVDHCLHPFADEGSEVMEKQLFHGSGMRHRRQWPEKVVRAGQVGRHTQEIGAVEVN